MKAKLSFVPNFCEIGNIRPTYSIGELDKEVSIYSASPRYVLEHGGPIAKSFVENIPKAFLDEAANAGLNVVLDVRLHRLNVGEFPSVPGWHCDGDVRMSYQAQPELDRPHGKHIICSVSSHPEGVSNFEFVNVPVEVEIDTEHPFRGFYAQVHEHVESKHVSRVPSSDGIIYQMDSSTIHRPMPTKVRGWRLFARASMYHLGYLEGEGKISKQQQVYILSEGNGW
jgi:hypothetical protein